MTTNPPSLDPLDETRPTPAVDENARYWTPRWIGALVVVVMLGELATFSYSLVGTALPGIGLHFHTADLGWTITVANLVTAVAVAMIGKLADLRGKRNLLVIVTTLSAVGGVVSAMAPNYEIFLLGRGLQGLLYVTPALGYSLIRDVFPKPLIAFAITVTFTGAGALLVVAPFIAGWLIDSFGPLSVFWCIAAFQAVCVIGVLCLLPESPLKVKSRLDWLGATLLGVGGALLVFGLGNAGTWGWTSVSFLGFMVAGIGCFAAWVWWDSSFPEPIIEISLLRTRPMWTTLVLNFAVYGPAAIVVSLIPLIVQMPRDPSGEIGFGSDAFGVALYMAPHGAAMVIGGFICGAKAMRWGIRYPMMVGCSSFAIGSVGLAFLHSESWQVLLWLLLCGIGMGATYGGLPNLVVQSAPPEKQGITSSIMLSAQNLSSAVAVQFVFAMLAMNAFTTELGTFFGPEGYRIAFLTAAAFSVAGLLVLKVMPHGRASDVRSVTTASDVVAQ
ncbi:MFS transporter [Rhodococcus opacus]|uniref:MFS transporter n=1 Tax=Rhodococcus opacus TaxID=37919 RepID=UPI001C4977CB|nr:MFS transporter [Rhodococcus opacus]MBV6761750.1 MFS transporter [Rhodococcus opacus]